MTLEILYVCCNKKKAPFACIFMKQTDRVWIKNRIILNWKYFVTNSQIFRFTANPLIEMEKNFGVEGWILIYIIKQIIFLLVWKMQKYRFSK